MGTEPELSALSILGSECGSEIRKLILAKEEQAARAGINAGAMAGIGVVGVSQGIGISASTLIFQSPIPGFGVGTVIGVAIVTGIVRNLGGKK